MGVCSVVSTMTSWVCVLLFPEGHMVSVCILSSEYHIISHATRGVTVSMSAFLACHQCYCAGSSLAWGLNLRAVVCDIF